MSERYALGNRPLATNPRRILLVKILNSTISGGGGGGGTGGLSGEGSPEGAITADAGATYVDTLTGDFYWKGSGSGDTGWLP